jgi:hypothetical protein
MLVNCFNFYKNKKEALVSSNTLLDRLQFNKYSTNLLKMETKPNMEVDSIVIE